MLCVKIINIKWNIHRYILLIRISRGNNNCGQRVLEKNNYFIVISTHIHYFYFNERLISVIFLMKN